MLTQILRNALGFPKLHFFSRFEFKCLLVLFCVVVLSVAGTNQIIADDGNGVATTTNLVLPKGAQSRNFTFSFPISDEEWQKGLGWSRRKVRVSGSLGIVEEYFTRNLYRIIVRLVGNPVKPVRGSLYLFLRKGKADASVPPRPPAPKNLRVSGLPLTPDFQFEGKGETSAFTIYQESDESEIWSRAFSEAGWGHMDEGTLEINGRYLLKAQQSNVTARYSPPTYVKFRVIGKKNKCVSCKGTGHTSPPQVPSNQTNPCSKCDGKGTILVPTLEQK